MITLTRRYRFSATHRLHSERLNEEQNRDVYGKCNHPFGHGHDYAIEVSVTGPLDEATGRIADLETLDGLVAREVLARFEHKNLNTDVANFRELVPTTENLAAEVQRLLKGAWDASFGAEGPRLARIRIEETRKNSIELS